MKLGASTKWDPGSGQSLDAHRSLPPPRSRSEILRVAATLVSIARPGARDQDENQPRLEKRRSHRICLDSLQESEAMRSMRSDREHELEQKLVGVLPLGVARPAILSANLTELARPVREDQGVASSLSGRRRRPASSRRIERRRTSAGRTGSRRKRSSRRRPGGRPFDRAGSTRARIVRPSER
jgi:hypothetical protein